MDINSTGSITGLINRGIELSEENLLDEAEAMFNKAMSINPDNPFVYYNLGVLCIRKKKPVQAAEAFEKYFLLEPFSKKVCEQKSSIYNSIGALFFSGEDYKRAADYFKKALECSTTDKDAGYNLLLANTYIETMR